MGDQGLRRSATVFLTALTLVACPIVPAFAQSSSTQSPAQKAWAETSFQVKKCINLMFSSKNLTFDQIAAAGIAPNDQRILPAIKACQQYLTTVPRTNFPCTVTNSKGEQISTTCNESYAKEVDGSLVAISGEDFLRASGNGEKVVAANFETIDARNARLSAEERQVSNIHKVPSARPQTSEDKKQAQRDLVQDNAGEMWDMIGLMDCGYLNWYYNKIVLGNAAVGQREYDKWAQSALDYSNKVGYPKSYYDSTLDLRKWYWVNWINEIEKNPSKNLISSIRIEYSNSKCKFKK